MSRTRAAFLASLTAPPRALTAAAAEVYALTSQCSLLQQVRRAVPYISLPIVCFPRLSFNAKNLQLSAATHSCCCCGRGAFAFQQRTFLFCAKAAATASAHPRKTLKGGALVIAAAPSPVNGAAATALKVATAIRERKMAAGGQLTYWSVYLAASRAATFAAIHQAALLRAVGAGVRERLKTLKSQPRTVSATTATATRTHAAVAPFTDLAAFTVSAAVLPMELHQLRQGASFSSYRATKDCSENGSSVEASGQDAAAACSDGSTAALVTEEQFHDGSRGLFRAHPFNRRFSLVKKPVFPIEPRNLRLMYKRKAKRRRGRGDKSNAKGIRLKHVHLQAGRYRGPRSRTFEGGKTPLYRRVPKWPEAWLNRQQKTMEPLNLAKLRFFIERGRLDARFPITQRHLHDSRCVKVRQGVRLFNVNDYPFPYKITVEVSGADQSSIDAIKRVGGEVIIVYRNRLNLRAHVKPYKFQILPRTARPNLEMLHYLEKMRARGCTVKYIKPQWLIDEEKSLKMQLAEFEAETFIANNEGIDKRAPMFREKVEEAQERLLREFRLRETLAMKLEKQQQQQKSSRESDSEPAP